jgi:AraC-like DNA-binding protein
MYNELINTATRSYPFLVEHEDVKYIPHFHTETEIIYILSGEIEFTAQNEKMSVGVGDICIVPSGVIHNLYTHKNSKSYVIKLYPFEGLDALRTDRFVISKDDELYHELRESIEGIMREEKERARAYELAVNINAERIALALLRGLKESPVSKKETKHSSENTFLKNVIEYLWENLSSEITLSGVSGRLSFRKSNFCRYFKRITGNTFWNFYTMFRVERAAELLSHRSEENIISVAEASGFRNVRSFNKAFKDCYGCTPCDFRKKQKEV